MDVNITLASWSNLLIYSAMAVYALSFLIYAFDLFGKSASNQRAEASGTKASARTSARGSGTVAKSVSRTKRTSRNASVEGSDEAGTVLTADRPAQDSAANDEADSAGKQGIPAKPPARKLARVATSLIVIALLLHVSAIVTRGLSVMRAPWGNMMEYAMIVSALACIVYLVVLKFRDVRYLGTFVSGSILLTLGLAITVFYTPAAQLVPALRSYWILIHVPIAILSTALLSVSAALAVFQMIKTWRDAKHPRFLAFMDRLPAADNIESASYRIAAVGFITWTFTLVAGAIWAEVAWGRYWGWDSKEIWTFVVWVVYAAYLHSRATRGWSPTKVATLNLVGFVCIIFNFTIVNIYFNGLHAYSGVSS